MKTMKFGVGVLYGPYTVVYASERESAGLSDFKYSNTKIYDC